MHPRFIWLTWILLNSILIGTWHKVIIPLLLTLVNYTLRSTPWVTLTIIKDEMTLHKFKGVGQLREVSAEGNHVSKYTAWRSEKDKEASSLFNSINGSAKFQMLHPRRIFCEGERDTNGRWLKHKRTRSITCLFCRTSLRNMTICRENL